MELFTQLFGDLLAFVYHCVDRIVIYGYLSDLSRPEQVVHFFRNIVGVAAVSREVLRQRTADYQAWVEAFARPSGSNPLAVLIRPPGSLSPSYTVEYRQVDGWDQGMPVSAVLIHQYKLGSTPYSYLQENNARVQGSWLQNTSWTDPSNSVKVYVNSINTFGGTASVTIGPAK